MVTITDVCKHLAWSELGWFAHSSSTTSRGFIQKTPGKRPLTQNHLATSTKHTRYSLESQTLLFHCIQAATGEYVCRSPFCRIPLTSKVFGLRWVHNIDTRPCYSLEYSVSSKLFATKHMNVTQGNTLVGFDSILAMKRPCMANAMQREVLHRIVNQA